MLFGNIFGGRRRDDANSPAAKAKGKGTPTSLQASGRWGQLRQEGYGGLQGFSMYGTPKPLPTWLLQVHCCLCPACITSKCRLPSSCVPRRLFRDADTSGTVRWALGTG